jgi:hypothetical protein
MKKVALAGLAAVLALSLAPSIQAATCADDLRDLRQRLPQVTDGARREELTLLLEKARKDEEAGRINLCFDAVAHARLLLK